MCLPLIALVLHTNVINPDERDIVGTSNIGPGHCLVLRSFWP